MSEQLKHLVELGKTRCVVLQILPFDASAEAFINGMTSLFASHRRRRTSRHHEYPIQPQRSSLA